MTLRYIGHDERGLIFVYSHGYTQRLEVNTDDEDAARRRRQQQQPRRNRHGRHERKQQLIERLSNGINAHLPVWLRRADRPSEAGLPIGLVPSAGTTAREHQ